MVDDRVGRGVVGLDGAHVEVRAHWFVDGLDRCYGGVRSVIVSELLDRCKRLADGVALGPRKRSPSSAVVETVLRSRRAMQVDERHEACGLTPTQSFRQHIRGTLYVRVTVQWCDGPVPNRDPNVIKTRRGDIFDVGFRDPGVPVRLKKGESGGSAERFAESVFVDDCFGLVGEDAGGDPGF